MSYNNDEGVISENSPLFDYLKSIDLSMVDEYIESESKIEDKFDNYKHVTDLKKGKCSFKSYLYDYVFDEGWKNSQKKLYNEFSNHIIDKTLKSNLLNEYDSNYIKAFTESNYVDDSKIIPSDNIVNQMITQMSVLCITIAYAAIRMIYIKSSSDIMPSSFFVYGLDVLSLCMTIFALLPVAIRFSSTGKLVGQIRKLETSFLILLNLLISSKKLLTKSYSFIHEMEYFCSYISS